jgi:signal-transduction protein with cAMP-binding, CBS, and nucleotidyltransferase domain
MKPQVPIVRVREVMKSGLDIVDGMQTVSSALRNMQFPETRTLIVDKRHEDDEYGVVMFRDVAKRVLAPDLSPERINVYEIMSKPVSRAPVVEDGRIIGLVSYTDIVLKAVMMLED